MIGQIWSPDLLAERLPVPLLHRTDGDPAVGAAQRSGVVVAPIVAVIVMVLEKGPGQGGPVQPARHLVGCDLHELPDTGAGPPVQRAECCHRRGQSGVVIGEEAAGPYGWP